MKSKPIPILSAHATLGSKSEFDDEIEYEEILYETETMPVEDWKQAVSMSWMTVVHLCLKVSYFIALYLYNEHGIKYMDFCSCVLEQSKSNKFKVLNHEYVRLEKYIVNILEGDGEVDYSDISNLPKIRWPIEELAFISYSTKKEKVYEEIREMTESLLKEKSITVDNLLVDELFLYQQKRLISVDLPVENTEYSWNFPEFFSHAMINEKVVLEKKKCISTLSEEYKYEDLEEFAKYHVWFGRRGKRFYYLEKWN